MALVGIVRRQARGDIVIPPERALGFWTPTLASLWQRALAGTQTMVIAGAAPTSEEVFPQLFDDAINPWQPGKCEGESVFRAEDPGGAIMQKSTVKGDDPTQVDEGVTRERPAEAPIKPDDAGIRINLRRIGGQK